MLPIKFVKNQLYLRYCIQFLSFLTEPSVKKKQQIQNFQFPVNA